MKWLKNYLTSKQYLCEYREKCSGYKDDSYTCTDALDKSYCGTYKVFVGMIIQ